MIRLHHADNLYPNGVLTLQEGQTHYLRHVLRARIGHSVIVFNERDGEWSSVLTELSKTTAALQVKERLRPSLLGPDISLAFAPLKHDPMTFLMEKATELGVRRFYPVTTERCNVSRLNSERLRRNLTEAAQQCERFDIPTLAPLMSLSKLLYLWDARISLFVCQERGAAPPIGQVLRLLPPQAPVGVLTGPEGGFSSQEIAYLKSFSFISPISLGPRILRAETAALAAVTCYQAWAGDWRDSSSLDASMGSSLHRSLAFPDA